MTEYQLHVIKPNGCSFVLKEGLRYKLKAIGMAISLAEHSLDEITVMKDSNTRICTFFGQQPVAREQPANKTFFNTPQEPVRL